MTSSAGPGSGRRIRPSPITPSRCSATECDRWPHKIDPVPAIFTLIRDPDDEPYLNLAIAVSAEYLVTRDNDMLDLMKDPEFRTNIPRLRFLIPWPCFGF